MYRLCDLYLRINPCDLYLCVSHVIAFGFHILCLISGGAIMFIVYEHVFDYLKHHA